MVALLVQTGLFDTSLTLCQTFNLSLTPVFEGLTFKCVMIYPVSGHFKSISSDFWSANFSLCVGVSNCNIKVIRTRQRCGTGLQPISCQLSLLLKSPGLSKYSLILIITMNFEACLPKLNFSPHSATDEAWRLLAHYLEKYPSQNAQYHRCVINKLLSHGVPVPDWLINAYKVVVVVFSALHPTDRQRKAITVV